MTDFESKCSYNKGKQKKVMPNSMTVYLDIVFLENIIMNYIILMATGKITKNTIKYGRIFFSSCIGGVYAVLSFLPNMTIYGNMLFKIILSIVMVQIAFEPKKTKELLKRILVFYLTSFALGGCAFALLYFLKPQNIMMKNGVLIGSYPLKVAFLGGIFGFLLIVTTFKIVKSKMRKKDMFCNIEVHLNGKEEEAIAMIDTGNMLKDPISKMPVVVVQKDNLKKILPEEILENLEKIIRGDVSKTIASWEEEYISKFRVIPFSSIGKEHGLLLGFKADFINIEYDGNEQRKENVIIGIYENSLSKTNHYTALIGLDLLGEEEIKNESFRDVKI